MNQKVKVKSGPICRSSESVSGLLPDSLSEALSGFLYVVGNLQQGRMEEASLNRLSLGALPCSRKCSCPTTKCRCTHVYDLIKYTHSCYIYTHGFWRFFADNAVSSCGGECTAPFLFGLLQKLCTLCLRRVGW